MQQRPTIYSGAQVSLVVLAGCILLSAAAVYFAIVSGSTLFWILAAILPIVALLVFVEHLVIDEGSMYLSYGIGFLKFEYDLNTIHSVMLGPNNSLRSWIFDPFGLEALIVNFRDGTSIALGNKDRQRLLNLLRAKIGR